MSVRLERWSREELIARIRELEAERVASQLHVGSNAPNADEARLTPREREAVAALVGRDYVPSEDVARALFGAETLLGQGLHNDDRHTARVYLGRADHKLRAVGWRITRRMGYGYRLEQRA